MIIQAEVSFYPLRTEAVGIEVNRFLTSLRQSGLQVQTGSMSSRITGELAEVFAALTDAFSEVAVHSEGVLVVKASNACPPAGD
ncbi:MAG: hypothetical protein C4527_12265 [Candidatus Omnitrophota bacterium]|jgi:uncharacterized protein YqgV (UPF0045/DUF77 family)|nr:MAG: hypothetical protein C4527_12265 [Candidatus Omnitrophota bacterium]